MPSNFSNFGEGLKFRRRAFRAYKDLEVPNSLPEYFYFGLG